MAGSGGEGDGLEGWGAGVQVQGWDGGGGGEKVEEGQRLYEEIPFAV